MRNSNKILAFAAAALCFAACTQKTTVHLTLENAPERDVVVKVLDGSVQVVVDTIRTNSSGEAKANVKIEKGQPLFTYLYYGETKLASLLLAQGDKVCVEADTLGNWTVSGSPESEKLQDVEFAFMQFNNELYAARTDVELYQKYIAYYRDRVKYVMGNSHSLTVVPVLYQNFEGFPIFSQDTDAILFSGIADSLKSVYPDSKYVKALQTEAQTRLNYLELRNRLQNAEQRGFPELSINDINGKKVSLDDVDAKAILVYFWSSAVPAQNNFNTEVLLPLYNDYHSKGFEIYAVAVDVDKTEWAATVKGQKLPWINVNDGLGNASPALLAYNVATLPTFFLIENGQIISKAINGEKALRAELRSVLN